MYLSRMSYNWCAEMELIATKQLYPASSYNKIFLLAGMVCSSGSGALILKAINAPARNRVWPRETRFALKYWNTRLYISNTNCFEITILQYSTKMAI